jgi:hypothetical protein
MVISAHAHKEKQNNDQEQIIVSVVTATKQTGHGYTSPLVTM